MQFGKLSKAEKAQLSLTSKSTDEQVRKAFGSNPQPIWYLRESAKLLPNELKLVKHKQKIKLDVFVGYDTNDQFTTDKKSKYTKYTHAQIIKMLQHPSMIQCLNDAAEMASQKQPQKIKLQFGPSSIKKLHKMSMAWMKKRGMDVIDPKSPIFRVSCIATVQNPIKTKTNTKTTAQDLVNRSFGTTLLYDFPVVHHLSDRLTKHFKHRKYRGTLYFLTASVSIDPIYSE